jgi:ribosomal protein L22
MGFIAYRQRREIARNTARIADAIDGGPAARNQQILQAGEAARRAEYDRIVAKRCKKAGMTPEEIATFLGLDNDGRAMWSAAHPQYKKLGY